MNIKSFFHEPTWTFTYVVWDSDTSDAVIIDPVLDYDPQWVAVSTESVDAVIAFVREHDLHVHYVLDTHAHADHLSAHQHAREQLGARIGIGEHIVPVQEVFRDLLDLGPDFAADGSQWDVLLKDGEPLQAGSLAVEPMHTPGHTPACTTLKIRDALFTGDTMFMPDFGTGRCDFPGGSAEQLYDSIQKLYRLPDDTRVFVGHDYGTGGREIRNETTIGDAKRDNIQLAADTSKADFVRFRTERDATLAPPRLIFPSLQVNADGGRLPKPAANGRRYMKAPIGVFAGPR